MTEVLTYRASADAFVFWVSLVVSVVFLAVGVGSLRWGLGATSGGMRIIAYGVMLFSFGVLALAYLYSPRAYRVTDSSLVVDRPLRDVEIAMDSVESVEPYEISLGGSTRTFGNGGLFGVYGQFRNEALGSFRIYGSRLGDAVLVRTDRGPMVLTPDDSERFTSDVRARLTGGG